MKRYLFIICTLLFASSLMAQQPNGFVNQLPDFPKISTPMAASFQKYIDNPINLYNGTPDISIPLLEINDGEINLPVALRYNSSGIRANEEASWVGLGWNLNVGGVITQSVVGESDYNDTEYIKLLNALGLSDFYPLNGVGSVAYNPSLQANIKDYFGSPNLLYHAGKLNPDVFYYSYPGGSGKFIIDYRDNSTHLLNREENLKIEISATNSSAAIPISEFKITTTEGIVHRFMQRTSVYPDDFFYRPVSVSFVLTSSVYPNGQSVLYGYTTTPVKIPGKTNVFQVSFESTGQDVGDYYYSNTETLMNGTEFYMNKMWTTHYEVTFNLSDRDDVYSGKQLTSIQVTPLAATSPVLKDVRFSYSYFVASSTTPAIYLPGVAWKTDYETKRLRLDAVHDQSVSLTNDRYSFEYNNTVPNKYTYNVDYWGYYNGTSGIRRNTYLPDISQMKWGRFYTLSPRSDLYDKFQTHATYSNRAYSFADCRAGILQKVKYPTGGYVTYEYEANSFMDKKVPDKISETIVNEDWNTTGSGPTNFSVPANSNATVEVVLSRGLNTWQEIWQHGGGSFALLHMSSGTPGVILQHSFEEECLYYANHYPDAGEIVFKTTISLPQKDVRDYPYTYILSADFPYTLGSQNGASTKHGSTRAYLTYSLSSTMVDAEIQGCGLRVKSIKQYDSQRGAATLLLETEYEYKNPDTGVNSGILHEEVAFVKPYYATLTFWGKPHESEPMIIQNVAEVTNANSISNPYASIGGVGYSYVKETRKSVGTIAGYTVYQFHNSIPNYVFGNIRMDNPLNGKLLGVKEHKNASTLLKSETYTYSSNLCHSYFGVNILDNVNMFTGIYANHSKIKPISFNGIHQYTNGYYSGRLRILWHSINSYNITMTKKESMQDDVSTTEEYTYDTATLQLLKRTVKLSGNDSLTYAYAYPNHFNFAPYTEMTLQNRIKPVVETRLLKKGNMQRGVLTQYAAEGSKIFPARQYESGISGSIGNPVTLTASGVNTTVYPYANVVWSKHNIYGNPVDVSAGGVNTVYLWAYENRYLVAKIEGATYTEVLGWLSAATINSLAANNTTVDAALNTIRSILSNKNVLVTTYTYLPLVGMTSMTAPNGTIIKYEYDSFGRLIKVRDRDNKVIEQYDYNYR